MVQSHLTAAMSYRSERPHSACSVNYVSANTNAWSRPERQSAATTTSASTAAPILPPKRRKRVQFRTKAKKAFTSAKKGLKIVSAYVRTSSSGSAAALKTLNRAGSRLSMHVPEPPFKRTSTPSFCLTKPTYKGVNVRLSMHEPLPAPVADRIPLPSYRDSGVHFDVHQVPLTPESMQTAVLDDLYNPRSDDKRKSMRFQHPAVSDVIATQGASNRLSAGQETVVSSVYPATPTTIATVEFEEGPINPKQVFHRRSHAVDIESFSTFKDVMDGVRTKSPPRAARPATVSAAPPSLPYIAFAPTVQMDESNDDTASEKTVTPIISPVDPIAPSTTSPVSPLASSGLGITFAEISHPNTLAIGSGVPLSAPRTTAPRPHTTGELNFLPYIPFIPPFNPYGRSPTPSSSSPNLTSQAKPSAEPSADDLAAAFAEAEAAEELVRHKRHTTLYADVESGFTPLPVLPLKATAEVPAVMNHIRRKAVPTAAPAAAASAVTSDDSLTVPAKPQPKPTPMPSESGVWKPLPPVPGRDSPRRYTRGIVPALPLQESSRVKPVAADFTDIIVEEPGRREKRKAEMGGGETARKSGKVKNVKPGRAEKARAFEAALRKLF